MLSQYTVAPELSDGSAGTKRYSSNERVSDAEMLTFKLAWWLKSRKDNNYLDFTELSQKANKQRYEGKKQVRKTSRVAMSELWSKVTMLKRLPRNS